MDRRWNGRKCRLQQYVRGQDRGRRRRSTWNSETFAQNQNANAIRWGTLYNFRFDSNRPPQTVNATVGFFKTGAPITVQVQGPSPAVASNVSVSGRVLTWAAGTRGQCTSLMTNSGGNTRTALTNSFGYYRFRRCRQWRVYTIGAFNQEDTISRAECDACKRQISNIEITELPVKRR